MSKGLPEKSYKDGKEFYQFEGKPTMYYAGAVLFLKPENGAAFNPLALISLTTNKTYRVTIEET